MSYSVSGTTTLRVASERPLVPILNLTQDEKIMRKLAVVWGVRSEKVGELESFNDVGEVAERILRKTGLAKSGQEAVITAGIPFAKRGNTNILHILTIK